MIRTIVATLAPLIIATSVTAQDTTVRPAAYASVAEIVRQAERADSERLNLLTTRPAGCGALCLMPPIAARGVATVTEPEVITFIDEVLPSKKGLLIDARPIENRAAGVIPGAVNVPPALLSTGNPYRDSILQALGGAWVNGRLVFTDPPELVVFDNGPTDANAVGMIEALVAVGYPRTQISYYRGGMLTWIALGLQVADTAS